MTEQKINKLNRTRIISTYLNTIGKQWEDISAYERTVLSSFADELIRQTSNPNANVADIKPIRKKRGRPKTKRPYTRTPKRTKKSLSDKELSSLKDLLV